MEIKDLTDVIVLCVKLVGSVPKTERQNSTYLSENSFSVCIPFGQFIEVGVQHPCIPL